MKEMSITYEYPKPVVLAGVAHEVVHEPLRFLVADDRVCCRFAPLVDAPYVGETVNDDFRVGLTLALPNCMSKLEYLRLPLHRV